MTTMRVAPGTVGGSVGAPPSKSYTHRALVAAHLSHRRYSVMNPLDSDDTRATAHALESLGSRVRFSSQTWTLAPSRARRGSRATVDCGESGTTLRFVAALAATSDRETRLTGRGRLPDRPIRELLDALESLGATSDRARGHRSLPVRIRGPVHGARVRLDASVSSQFVSALLMILPTLSEDSTLELEGMIVSEPYIEATLAVLRLHGIRVARRGRRFSIPGGQQYAGTRMSVPGDASSAAYFWTAAAITGGTVRVHGVPREWPQSDLAILDLLRTAGARVVRNRTGATVEGGALRGFTVDLTASPDLYPLAGVLAASIAAPSRLQGAPHVVLKESDRKEGTRLLASAMGAQVHSNRRGLLIRGRAHPRAFDLRELHDHRLVMSAAVAALVADGPSYVGDARAVAKSFPGFWGSLATLRGESSR